MAAQTVDTTDRDRHKVYPLGAKISDVRSRGTRFRLTVLAPSVDLVVGCAGGWLFDRAKIGWDVTVAVPECTDKRPLQILGVETADLEDALMGKLHPEMSDAISVAVDLYQRDARVRRQVLREITRRQTEVTLWGGEWPTELDDRVDSVEHHLSVAARAFKVHALAATAAAPGLLDVVETFRIAKKHMSPVGGAPDLVPAS